MTEPSVNDWTPVDIALALGAGTGIHADFESTRAFLDEGRKESNPLLGERPSDAALTLAELLSLGATGTVAHVLPDPWRQVLLGGVAGLEHGAAQHNRQGPGSDRGPTIWKDPVGSKMTQKALIGALLGYALHRAESASGFSLGLAPGAQGEPTITLNKSF